MVSDLKLSLGWSRDRENRAWVSRNQSFSARGTTHPASFVAAPFLARWLDVAVDPSSQSLSQLAAGLPLAQAFAALERNQQEILRKKFGPDFLQQIFSLSQEPNSEMFWSGVLVLASRLEQAGKLEEALGLYSLAGDSAEYPELAQRARDGRDVLLGQGTFGTRFEFLTGRAFAGATDYRTILPMIAATTVAELGQSWSMGKIFSDSKLAWLRSPLRARGASALFGSLWEIPTFYASAQGLRALSGEATKFSWVDLGKTAFSLGAFKIFGVLPIPRPLGAFTGLWAMNKMEQSLGWRPQTDGALSFIDSLAETFSLEVGSSLGRGVLGNSIAPLQQELMARWTRVAKQAVPSMKNLASNFWEYWKNRPAGFVLMAFPPKASEPTIDSQVYERVQRSVRWAVVSEARKHNFTVPDSPSGSKQLKLDLYVDANSGRLLSGEDVNDRANPGLYGFRVRADLFQNKIQLSSNLIENIKSLIDATPLNVEQRSVVQGLLDLHDRHILEPERFERWFSEVGSAEPAPVEPENSAPIIISSKPPREDQTLPMFTGQELRPPAKVAQERAELQRQFDHLTLEEEPSSESTGTSGFPEEQTQPSPPPIIESTQRQRRDQTIPLFLGQPHVAPAKVAQDRTNLQEQFDRLSQEHPPTEQASPPGAAEVQTSDAIPIIESTKPPRQDQTLPLFMGQPNRPPAKVAQERAELQGQFDRVAQASAAPPPRDPVEDLQVQIRELARKVWEAEAWVDRPPLMQFITPSILVGTITLNAKGEIVHSRLGHPYYCGTWDPREPFSKPKAGTSVSLLLRNDGTLLSLGIPKDMPVKARQLLLTLAQRETNLQGQHETVREFPYLMSMIKGQGMGQSLLEFNEILSANPRADGIYAQRMVLVPGQERYHWYRYSRSLTPETAAQRVAIVEAGFVPRGTKLKGVKGFIFRVSEGALPSDVQELFNYLQKRVKDLQNQLDPT